MNKIPYNFFIPSILPFCFSPDKRHDGQDVYSMYVAMCAGILYPARVGVHNIGNISCPSVLLSALNRKGRIGQIGGAL